MNGGRAALIAALVGVTITLLGGLGVYIAFGPQLFGDSASKGGGGARAETLIEDCAGISFAGSNTIGDHLAPELLKAFMTSQLKYEVGAFVDLNTDGTERRVTGTKPGHKCTIDVRAHGSGKAFEELNANTTLIGMASRAIKQNEIDLLRASGSPDFAFATPDGKQAIAREAEHVIALDGIAIIVHPSNPVNALSMDQVRSIFLGETNNWGNVGGAPGPIARISRNKDSGTFDFFLENVLKTKDKEAIQNPRLIERSEELVDTVSKDPTAIGFVGAAFVSPGVKAIAISDGGPAYLPNDINIRTENYPIARRLYLYTRPSVYRDNTIVRAFIEYAKSRDGFGVVEAQHFVNLNYDTLAQISSVSDCIPGTQEAQEYAMATAGAEGALQSVVQFFTGSDTLDNRAWSDVRSVSDILARYQQQGRRINLVGHADTVGDEATNAQLARRRAEAVRQALADYRLGAISVFSAGEMCPRTSDTSAGGLQKNRRVEIWIVR